METVFRSFYDSDILWGGGATGAIAVELGIVGSIGDTQEIDSIIGEGIMACQEGNQHRASHLMMMLAYVFQELLNEQKNASSEPSNNQRG